MTPADFNKLLAFGGGPITLLCIVVSLFIVESRDAT